VTTSAGNNKKSYCSKVNLEPWLSYWASGGLLAGKPGGRAALSITPYMNRAGYCRQRNYCSKFTLLQYLFILLPANVAVGNLRWLSTQLHWAPTGTTVDTCGNGHGREHVPGANMSGVNMYQARTCTRRKHVGCELKGANLTPFFSKNTPKLPFLAEEAQMNFFNFFFLHFQL
jgi:hypothetical protein